MTSRVVGPVPPAGKSKPDWEIICLVAKALGLQGFDYKSAREIWKEMDIDQTWQPRIKVSEIPVTINTKKRTYGKATNNSRLLAQWHSMSRTGKSATLNDMTRINEESVSIHHTTNSELFEGKEVELDKYSKQPCFKG